MDNLLSRHRNVSILVAVLFAQVLGLAVQVKRSANAEESRLIRVWAVSAVTPFEKALVWTQQTTSGWWHNYLYLRGVRAELKKAEWPSRAQLFQLTRVVLLLILIVAVYVGALDGLLGLVTNRLFSR